MNTLLWCLFAFSVIYYTVRGWASIKHFFGAQIYERQTWAFVAFCASIIGIGLLVSLLTGR
jgi:hypothetical protein